MKNIENNPTSEILYSRALNVFLTVMSVGNFSLAAQKLGVTQSSVSQTILLFESKLGFNLFERDTRPLQPTPEAFELFNTIKKGEGDIRELLLRMQMRNRVKPAVRFGTIESVGHLIAADLCCNLRQELGEISLSTGTSGSLMKSLREESLDAAIVAGEDEVKGITKFRISADPWFAIFPKDFELPEETLNWQQLGLCGLPLIYHSVDTADGKILQDFFISQGIIFPKVFEVQSNDLIYDLVSKKLGWSLTHFFGLLGDFRRTKSLQIRRAPSNLESRNIYLAVRKNYSEVLFEKVKDSISQALQDALSARRKEPVYRGLF